MIIGSDVWKEFGFEAIIYLAALTAIDPTLYEVAELDGATRFQKMWSISIPSIAPVIVLVGCLSIGNVLNAGFDQIFNLYSPIVYSTGDIIDTYVYRVGLIQGQYSIGTAVGLLQDGRGADADRHLLLGWQTNLPTTGSSRRTPCSPSKNIFDQIIDWVILIVLLAGG